MDFLNRLLNRPTPKPAICQGSPTPQHYNHESASEASVPSSRSQSEPDHLIRFSRDFSEAVSNSSGPSSLIPESLSSASSFQSLASTLSSKSSSGICADSAPGSPDKVNAGNGFDHSYVNVDIPDLDDIISACTNINLNDTALLEESADELKADTESSDNSCEADPSLNQTFTSAAEDSISDETQVLVEETIQTFDTCPPLSLTQPIKSKTGILAASLPVVNEQSESSVIPYVSFEESVLRKHEEPVNDGAEFKSALTSFQPPFTVDARRRGHSPTPCEEIDVAQVAKDPSNNPKNLDIAQESSVADEAVEKKEDGIEQHHPLGTPDASFQEVQAFDATVLLNTDSTDDESKVFGSLNTTVSSTPNKSGVRVQEENKPTFSFDEVPVGVTRKEIGVVQETSPNKVHKVQDSVQDINVLNKTQDSNVQDTNVQDINAQDTNGQDTNVLNKTQDIAENTNVLNKIQNIDQETNILNKTQDIDQETNILNKTEDIVQEQSTLDKTQNIVQEQSILNKTEDIVQEQSTLDKTQNSVQEQNTLNKTEDIVKNKSNLIEEELTDEKASDSVNKNKVIVQKISNLDKTDSVQIETQILNKVDDLAETEETPIKSQIQEFKRPKTVEPNTDDSFKTPQKVEEIFLKPEVKNLKQRKTLANEEPQNLSLISTEAVSSTPLPVKNLNKTNTPKLPKSPQTKSALFVNEPKSIKSQEPQVLTQKKSTEVKEEKNKINFDQTQAINKSFDKSSFSATEPIADLETITNPVHKNLFPLLTHEPEYEAFKPVQQSTNLPFSDFEKLQEAALSVAKEIDDSLENIEEAEHFVSATTELFEDPSALDFLTHIGSQQPTSRGERYDSLYMKFDPLAQRPSMLPQKNLPSSQTVEEQEDKEKETKLDTPSTEMGTPLKNPALAAIDRLLFYSPTTPTTESAVAEAKQKKEEAEKQESPVVPIVDEKMVKELELVRSTVLQLESELEKQKEEHKENLEKLKAVYEEKVTHMQTKFTQMQSQLSQEVKCKGQMTVVVEEYEKSISRLIAEREKDRTSFEIEKAKLQEELQVANQHLSNTEAAFSDVHSKYERLKNIVSAYKSNETVLKESIAENQETIKALESRYEQMKIHAVTQLEKANLELVSIRKQNEAETVKLKALVRKAELKSKSLAETVEQKIKENKELTQIIDEMIARVD